MYLLFAQSVKSLKTFILSLHNMSFHKILAV